MRAIGNRKNHHYKFDAWLHDKPIKLDTKEESEAELNKDQFELMDRAVEQAKQRKLKELRNRGIIK